MVSLPLLLALSLCLLGSAPASPVRPLRRPCAFRPLPENLPDPADVLDSAEASVRSERSANISHIVGTSRKIQLIVSKSWYLQIHPDGQVNGTDTNTDSDYSKSLF